MALIECSECGREISDRAAACPGCGAPVSTDAGTQEKIPQVSAGLGYSRETDVFTGTMPVIVKLAMRAVQQLGWKIDDANESLGFVTFQTGISWGSWSGVSGTISIEEVAPDSFKVFGAGKQNIRGGQLFAPNIGGEAQGKTRKAINLMKELASQGSRT